MISEIRYPVFRRPSSKCTNTVHMWNYPCKVLPLQLIAEIICLFIKDFERVLNRELYNLCSTHVTQICRP